MRLPPIINYEAAKTAKKVGIWRLLHRLNDLDDCPLMRMHCKQLIEPHSLDCRPRIEKEHIAFNAFCLLQNTL